MVMYDGKQVIQLYVSEKKFKQFNKQGFFTVMKDGVIYQLNKKPEDIRIAKRIAKLKEKIRVLELQKKPLG